MVLPPTFPGRVLVTTSLAKDLGRTSYGKQIADELGARFIERDRFTLPNLFESNSEIDRVIIVEGDGLALHHKDGTVYRYHPNMGFVRALNALRGHRDLFVEAAALTPGERVLDCTLGFAGEAMMSALLVGEMGTVTGLESAPELAMVTREGLRSRHLFQAKLEASLRRINVICADYRSFLPNLQAGDYDLICFDPFFHERLEGSKPSVDPLFRFGDPSPLDPKSVLLAIHVASRRVLVKHPKTARLPSILEERRAATVGAKGKPILYSIFNGNGG